MKIFDHLRHSFACCLTSNPSTSIKNLLSSFEEPLHPDGPDPLKEDQESSLIDPAASIPSFPNSSHHRSTITGTIYGRHRGHVAFSVQSDPTNLPPFLFELSVPTALLVKEMHSGLLRIALECPRSPQRHISTSSWKAYCNGHKVGYAVRRKPTDWDKKILQTVRLMTAGAGVLTLDDDDEEEGEVFYMRACYERVVGSRDSVSYHMINPDGGVEAQKLN